jgi:hypothetical protein
VALLARWGALEAALAVVGELLMKAMSLEEHLAIRLIKAVSGTLHDATV